jgi:hypothetical protein
MSVSSINDHIKPPKGAVFLRSDVRHGWFVVTYKIGSRTVEFFYNDQGREVFRVDHPAVAVGKWQRFKKFLREAYANSDSQAGM